MSKKILLVVVEGIYASYQLVWKPIMTIFFSGYPSGCRYQPSCSAYARQALSTHRTGAEIILIAKRMARCHPWAGYGYDPVPEPSQEQPSAHPRSS